MPHLLLVEDDPSIRSGLSRALTERGHVVSSASTAMSGLQAALDEQPEVVLLDLGLPDVDGGTLLGMLRAVSAVPVIVVTARDDEAEIVRLLDVGADDYVVKPFSAQQIDARIRAVLRRAAANAVEGPLVVGGLSIDLRRHEASLDGKLLELTRKEFELLHHLACRAGEVVPKKELLAEVWRRPYGGADKTVDVHLSWLRRKLGETADSPRYLYSVRGWGFAWRPRAAVTGEAVAHPLRHRPLGRPAAGPSGARRSALSSAG